MTRLNGFLACERIFSITLPCQIMKSYSDICMYHLSFPLLLSPPEIAGSPRFFPFFFFSSFFFRDASTFIHSFRVRRVSFRPRPFIVLWYCIVSYRGSSSSSSSPSPACVCTSISNACGWWGGLGWAIARYLCSTQNAPGKCADKDNNERKEKKKVCSMCISLCVCWIRRRKKY
ncbi:hypothetical protein F4809DRAFT_303809 [Biscogniauxia mediterranea]|nr:hypothetical protein F4809DRAFT_303809 [Biscogniauxia mediterranea]